MSPPGYTDVQAAARRLDGIAHRTPVITSRTLDAQLGMSVFFKCENLQRVGAFKFRGAYNAVAQLTAVERQRGLIAYSSGNHAQAVALAARLFECDATIVMPANAPRVKRAATEGYGARVVAYDSAVESREQVADRLMAEREYTLVPPFDHPHIVAGQGTSALELLQETPALDALLVPCGGGGLLSGCALAAHGAQSGCRVIGVEPQGADDAVRSFRSGVLQRIEAPDTIADGVRTPSLGELPFALIREHVHDMCTVSEEAIGTAVALAFLRLKMVIEPSGALGLAALLSGELRGYRRVGVLVSGGNVDQEVFCRLIAAVNLR